jgi:hypothetical protein
MQSQARSVLEAAKHGPLQSLTEREMDVHEQPMAIYPRPKRVRAWVRFSPEAVRIDAKLVRSTPLRRRHRVSRGRSDVPLLDASLSVK